MGQGQKSRPPLMGGVFVLHDLTEEHLGPRPRAPRKPMLQAEAPSIPDPRPIVPSMPSRPKSPPPGRPAAPERRVDARAEGTLPAEEVAFGNVSVRRGPPTIPVRSLSSESVAGSRAHKLLDELGRCGPGAEGPFLEPMRALGEVGLEAMRRDFPGLLWFDRNLPHRREPRGRDVSPLASLLFQLGPAADAVIRALLEHDDSDVRYYAILLAGDRAEPALLDAVAARLFDTDVAIVRHALAILGAVGGPARIDRLGLELAEILQGHGSGWARRLRAIELLAELRHPRGLEGLVQVLDCGDATLAASAVEALRRLTAHDPGTRSGDWAKLLRAHRGAPRHAWLLDALVGKDAALRDLAAAELARLTGQTFGYAPGAALSLAKTVRAAHERVLAG